MIWTTKQLQTALSIKKLPNNTKYSKVQFNSQSIKEGDLFIALPGQRDGHDFVGDALKRGAGAAIVSQDIKGISSDKLIKVADTTQALLLLSDYKRRLSKAKIIAVTGSTGKTSTKEALRTMLEAYGNVHANYGTFNNHLGIPLTLASMPDKTDYAVVEMGMNAKGELSALSTQVVPDIAVITTISEGHLEFFNSVEEIVDAKCEIFEGLDINNGIAIINRDLDVYEQCVHNIDIAKLKNIKTFGKHSNSDTCFISHEILNNQNTRLVYKIGDNSIELIMNSIIPVHLAENLAAAFTVIDALGLDSAPAVKAISSFQILLGRGRLISSKKNGNKYKIICDYYNSNPQSLQASLKHLAQFKEQNKIAILGDMAELGSTGLSLHKNMVPYIKESGASKVLLVGSIMKQIKEYLPDDLSVRCYINVDELVKDIDQHTNDGDLILIKGSRSIGLEKIAQYLGVKNAL